MKKTIVYILILGLLASGAYFFLNRDETTFFKEKEANFNFPDTSIIGKIFLVENNGSSITVERGHTNSWILNNQYPVMPVQIKNILYCLKQQSAQKPVSERDHNRVVKLLSGLSTKVEVYNRDGKKMKTFYVAGQGSNYQGSFMINEGASTPYLVEIKGYDGYLTPFYTTEFNQWRSRNVFDIKPDSIQSIEVIYPNEPMNNYKINNNIQPQTIDVYEALKKSYTTEKINKRRLNDYLGFFKNINAEAYINNNVDTKEAIEKSILRCHFNVVEKNGKASNLDIYYMDETDKYKTMKDQTSTDPNNRPMDVDRMYAINHSTKDTMVIQFLSFEKLFRKSYEFFMTEEQIIQRQKQLQEPHDHNHGPMNPNEATIKYL